MATRVSRRRLEAISARFTIRRYTVPEDGPHAADYVTVKCRAEERQRKFDALPADLRATINAVGDVQLARSLAAKGVTDHRQAELVKADLGWRSQEAHGW